MTWKVTESEQVFRSDREMEQLYLVMLFYSSIVGQSEAYYNNKRTAVVHNTSRYVVIEEFKAFAFVSTHLVFVFVPNANAHSESRG